MSEWKERKWKINEETRQRLHEILGLEDCFARPLKALSLVILIWDAMIFPLAYGFSRQLRLFLQVFILRFFNGKGQNKSFKGHLRAALGKLKKGTTFIKKGMIPWLYHSMLFPVSHIRYCSNWWKLPSFSCFLQST